MHWLDSLHARLRNDGLFFSKGWGDPTTLKLSLVDPGRLPSPEFELQSEIKSKDSIAREYKFLSPYPERPLPQESAKASFLIVLPLGWDSSTRVCIHLACTGDQGYTRRQRLLAEPLLEHGIGSLILENPYYGARRPKDQKDTYINTVADLWLMGLTAATEARVILAWLKEQGFKRLGISGISMGGQITSHVAALYPEPLAACACIAPSCASTVFLDGVLSKHTNWKALHESKTEARLLLKKQLDRSELKLFPKPKRADCFIWVAASYDAYVDPKSCRIAQATWPESTIRWLPSGHISSVIFRRKAFVQGILDAFNRLDLPPREFGSWLP